jgi:uncharacterized protein
MPITGITHTTPFAFNDNDWDVGADNLTSISGTLTGSGNVNGSYTIKFEIVDGSGNVILVNGSQLSVQMAGPNINFNSPNASTSWSLDISSIAAKLNALALGVGFSYRVSVFDAGTEVTEGAGTTYTSPSYAIVCFLRGTLILTERGEVAVENLVAGDRVATRFGGLRPIVWIGTQKFDGRFARGTAAPVRFRPGSLGVGLPHTDLFVSPGHAMLVGEVLAHAGALVNADTITQHDMDGPIEYFHLDLGSHDCVLANGAWAESYFEDRNRDAFHNRADFHARFPGHAPVRQETCMPILVEGHPDLPAIRERLAPAPRAPQLLADGIPLPFAEVAPGTWEATIPEGIGSLRLRSPTLHPEGEARTLGLMVYALMFEGSPLTPAGQGWHAAETDGAMTWTWTNGNAAISLPTLAVPGQLTLRGWLPHTAALARAA